MANLREDDGDAGTGIETRYVMEVGDTFRGTLEPSGDADGVRIALEAGERYELRLDGAGANALRDPLLIVLDPAGEPIAFDDDGGAGTNALLRFTPRSDGVYTLVARTPDGESTGDYQFAATRLEPHVATTGTYDEIARQLTDGFWESIGQERRRFEVDDGAIRVNLTALGAEGQQLARWALESWTRVADIDFRFVDGDAHITFDEKEEGAYTLLNVTDGRIDDALVNISATWIGIFGAAVDSETFTTYVHEIGHALGLGHPGDYNVGGTLEEPEIPTWETHAEFLNDSYQATVMSYFSQAENQSIDASRAIPVTPMIVDIIAIQELYGPPSRSDADDVYGVGASAGADTYLGQLFAALTGNRFGGIRLSRDSAPAFADLDGDGDLDVFVGGADGSVHYFENTGTGTRAGFTARSGAANPLDGVFVDGNSAPAFADLDGDGDLDVMIGEAFGRLRYFENAGTRAAPRFTERSGSANPLDGAQTVWNSAPAFADLDGDGDLDALVGEQNGSVHYFENTGTPIAPRFVERRGPADPLNGADVGELSAPALADLDGDGDLDAVVGEKEGGFRYFENTGTRAAPRFVERSGAANPFDGFDAGSNSGPAFADLDGDGDQDLVTGSWGGRLYFFENTGTRAAPRFTERGDVKPVTLTLYDTGGNDTLDLRIDVADQRVDLRPEAISDVLGLIGNLIIARDTVIEHFIAGSGDDVVIGNSAPNRLEGHAGADELRGGEGDDTLLGGAGADRLHGGAGADLLEGGGGADRLDGGAGSDSASYAGSGAGVVVDLGTGAASGGDAEGDRFTSIEDLRGSAHGDRLVGDGGANRLHGGAGRDLLEGGAGADLLEGGGGADRLDGGTGSDSASYAGSGAGVVVDLGTGAASGGDAEGDRFTSIEDLRGSAHGDRLVGDGRANRLYGGAGDDRLDGRAGTDVLHGELGSDTLIGGEGNDRLYGEEGADRIEGGAGADWLRGGGGDDWLVGGPGADRLAGHSGEDTASYAGSDAGVVVDLGAGEASGGHAEGDTFSGIEHVSGSGYGDRLVGDGGANRLTGGAGGDRLYGGAGDDRLDGGEGNDVLHGGSGDDRLIGGEGNDRLYGEEGADRIEGGAGADWLRGGGGDDWLVGGSGADRLAGHSGEDTASYAGSDTGVVVDLYTGEAWGGHAAGDTFSGIEHVSGSGYGDRLLGDGGANRLIGGAGNDRLYGEEGDDRLIGGEGNDRLYGEEGADRIEGGAGADWLRGGGGDDWLVGGSGADRLAGHSGEDTASYAGSDTGVVVDLYTGEAWGGHAAGDTFSGIEHVSGSGYGDRLLGDDGANRLTGGAGKDWLHGGAGADRLDGGSGTDTVSYEGSDAGVTVNLATRTGTGGHAEGDTYLSVENVRGTMHRDVLIGDGGANRLYGAAGDDSLRGAGGDDWLHGDAGADRLDGGGGTDTVSYEGSKAGVTVSLATGTGRGGQAAGDTLSGIENVIGSAHEDSLTGDGGANRLHGGDADDVLQGGAGADWLYGGTGDDRLTGGAGADALYGEAGSRDRASYERSNLGVTVSLATGTGRYGHAEGDRLAGIEDLVGSDYDDTLGGDAGANRLHGGGGGNDRLEGGAGDDSLYGGDGNDTLQGGADADRLYGGTGSDSLQGEAGADRLHGGEEDDTLAGGEGGDLLSGDAGADRLDGGEGVDTASYAGSDQGVTVNLVTGRGQGGDAEGDALSAIENLVGSSHDDTFIGAGGANRLDGGAGVDTVSYVSSDTGVWVSLLAGAGRGGHAEGDRLVGIENLSGSAHGDTLIGDGGANRLDGSGGHDRLEGGAGDDWLYGGDGHDTLLGGSSSDRLDGGADLDTVSYEGSNAGVQVNLATGAVSGGHAGGDTLSSIENLVGSSHDDTLTGDGGANRISGGGGHDRLEGGGGDDRLIGGRGGDAFVYRDDGGHDVIADFENGRDRIDLHAFRLSDAEAGRVLADASADARGVRIDLSAHDGGTILLEGFAFGDLDASDFLF